MATSAPVSRSGDNTIVIIIRRQPEAIPLPSELQGVLSQDKWDSRLSKIQELCARYGKPMFERIFFVVATLTTIILPAALNRTIFNAITPKAIRDAFDRSNHSDFLPSTNRFDGDFIDEGGAEKYITYTRLINTALIIGLLIVFWVPFGLWKYQGKRRGRALVTRWAVEDGSQGASFVPQYTISTPGVWSTLGAVRITTPPNIPPTLFNPQAYMPSYMIAQPGEQFQGPPQIAQVPYNPAFRPFDLHPGPPQPQWTPPSGAPPTRRPPPPAENPFTDFESFKDEKNKDDFETVKV